MSKDETEKESISDGPFSKLNRKKPIRQFCSKDVDFSIKQMLFFEAKCLKKHEEVATKADSRANTVEN